MKLKSRTYLERGRYRARNRNIFVYFPMSFPVYLNYMIKWERMRKMKTEWDYTNLAEAYLKRPEYAESAIDEMLRLTGVQEGTGYVM